VYRMLAAVAEFIRELIVEGTREGLAAARARGQRLGRPPALSADQVRQARALLTPRRIGLVDCPPTRRLPLDALQVPTRAQRRRPSLTPAVTS
jgi:hypothetical protein